MPQATLRLAIANRRLVQLFYRLGNRVVEPYIYGANRDGNEVLRVYQVGGGSAHSQSLGWKLISTGEIGTISMLGDSFVPRPDYLRNDPAMEQIFVQV